MKKKINLEKIVHVIEQVMKNRLIIAIMLIVDGIVFLMNPEQPVENMGRTLAVSMAFAAAVMIFARIVAKERFVRFIPALILLALGGLMYFFPDMLSAYFRLILALVIIMNGIVNLLSVLGVNYSQGFFGILDGKVRNAASKIKSPKEMEEGFDEQAVKYLNPLQRIVSASKGNKTVFFITSLLSILLGLLVLIKPDVSISVFGVIFLYIGVCDFLLAFRTQGVSAKLREKKYREILFDPNDVNENRPEGAAEGAPEGGEKQE